MVIVKCDKNLLGHLFWLAKYLHLFFVFSLHIYENADPYDVFTLAMIFIRSYMFSGSLPIYY